MQQNDTFVQGVICHLAKFDLTVDDHGSETHGDFYHGDGKGGYYWYTLQVQKYTQGWLWWKTEKVSYALALCVATWEHSHSFAIPMGVVGVTPEQLQGMAKGLRSQTCEYVVKTWGPQQT